MGAGEGSSPAKQSKPSVTQETHPPTYADWSASMQAYYGGGAPPPFYPPIVASPTPHPYMWGGQHPMMPPYGAPVPYPTLYSPPEVYAHPSTPMAIRQKVASSSGNDGTTTQSAESENDGSSDANLQNDKSGNPVVHTPATAKNVAAEMQSNPLGGPQTGVPPPIMGQWPRAECEELQSRVEVLSNENQALKDEMQRLSEECKKLTTENDSMKGKLTKFCEPEAVQNVDAQLKSQENEGQQ
ncbi:hypothetical protein M8C21_012364 [Ambrosia artemisiifolia]|uniref:BZIP domain-containing protein n=1 Tax=Ambrosia artemisiifolia TaxID=4212 RepID=A0AAD5D1T5_AMBAR|nr:hypothetical protein M8C21_012364 [Ambrosia artemisiifolia]